jgi:hypothetical protein
MWYALENLEKCTRFSWGSLKERNQSEDQELDGRIESEWILGRLAWGMWSRSSRLRLGTGDGIL